MVNYQKNPVLWNGIFCQVLLLYYFIGYRDEAIGRLYRRCRSTINSRRNVALKQLRKEWERLEHEEQKTDTV